ncbi:hypothetical protein [Maioricimonas sp. JC845]|uniref:WD40 repeat domain-containing protein n=1 Tax=Maioricimonas sp. JC845 TaxID=3232138 RepID=UPI00345A8E8D
MLQPFRLSSLLTLLITATPGPGLLATSPASAAEYRSLPVNPQRYNSHLAFSPDGRFLAGAGYTHRKNRGQVTVWDLPSGEISLTQLFPKYCQSPHFSPDSSLLAFTSHDHTVYVIRHHIEKRRTRWRLVARLPGPRVPKIDSFWALTAHVRFSPDGSQLARSVLGVAPDARSSTGRPSAMPGGIAFRVELWPTDSFSVPDRVLHSAGGRVCQLAFLNTGSDTLLTSVGDRRGTNRLRTIDLEEDTITADIAHHQITDRPSCYGFSFDVSPRNQQIALGGCGFLVLLDPRSFQITRRFTVPGEYYQCQSLSFSPDGRLLVSCGSPHTLRLWDVSTGDLLVEREYFQPIDVAFSPDGQTIASTGSLHKGSPSVLLWDVRALLRNAREEAPNEAN